MATIYNSANDTLVSGTGGNDEIQNVGFSSVYPYWQNGGKNVTIDAGNGDDYVSSHSTTKVSIDAGAGNDSISLNSYAKNNLIQYSAGDGFDSIVGFDANDTLKIFGDSYSTQKSGSNVIVTVGNEKISLVGAASLETVNIDLEENFWTLDGTTATYISGGKSSATVKGVKSVDGLSVDGDTIKLAASALKNKVTVSGDYVFDFAEDYSRATIMGSDADDTIIARGKYISVKGGAGDDTLQLFGTGTLTGGSGSDTFVYDGKGNDVVTDYAEKDTIKFEVAVKKISKTKAGSVVLTVGSGKITLKEAGDKIVAYEDSEGKHYYPVNFSSDGETAKLLKTYGKDSFDISDFEEYKNSVETIDASKVTIDLNIIGNKLANVITGTSEDDYIDGQAGSDTVDGGKGNDTLLGGAGDDSLWGGVGSDTLFGGAGEDVFCYSLGDGKDVIEDYKFGVDTVMILSGEVKAPKLNGAGDVTFKIGSGQITFANSADKSIELVDTSGNVLSTYTPK